MEVHQAQAVQMMNIMLVLVEMVATKEQAAAVIQIILREDIIIAVHQQVQALAVRLIAGQMEAVVHNQEALHLTVGQEVLLLLILHHQAVAQAIQVVAAAVVAEAAVGQDNLSFKI